MFAKIKNCYINKYVNLMLSCTQKQIVMKKNAVHYKNKYNNGKKDKVDQKEQNIKNYIEKQKINYNKNEKNLRK